MSILTWVFIAPIKLYQWIVSPVIGNRCRFYPTCSEYSVLALQEFGIFKGVWLTIKRLLKCHPFNPGGIDTLPRRFPYERT